MRTQGVLIRSTWNVCANACRVKLRNPSIDIFSNTFSLWQLGWLNVIALCEGPRHWFNTRPSSAVQAYNNYIIVYAHSMHICSTRTGWTCRLLYNTCTPSCTVHGVHVSPWLYIDIDFDKGPDLQNVAILDKIWQGTLDTPKNIDLSHGVHFVKSYTHATI